MGSLPNLEAMQRPHPAPTMQLAATPPTLLSSHGQKGREDEGKTHLLRVSTRILPS